MKRTKQIEERVAATGNRRSEAKPVAMGHAEGHSADAAFSRA